MNSEEHSPFQKLREIAIKISTVDDAKADLIDVVSLMSEINNLYISISYERYEIMKKLEEIAENARKQQIIVEESLHSCQLLADQNLSNKPPEVDTKGIEIPTIQQFQEETGLTDEDINSLQESGQLLYKRMDHEIQKIPAIKEEYNNANTTRFELRKKLDNARTKYSFLITKIQKMYDEIMGTLKNLD